MASRIHPAIFRSPWRLALATGLVLAAPAVHAQAGSSLAISSEDYTLSAVRSDIESFSFDIELDAPLVAGERYENPSIRRLSYRVVGALEAGTPSGFERFDLQRELEGDDFYAQGSSLVFALSPSAVLDDGVQVVELAGDAVVFLFDGREIGTGRFHPARFELRADGTGRLQNSNNQPDDDDASTIAAGAEYITDLAFDAGNTTVLDVMSGDGDSPNGDGSAGDGGSSGGGGAATFAVALLPWLSTRRRTRGIGGERP